MSAYTWQTANTNGRTAQRLHQVRFPNRRLPPYSTFVSINRRLMKTGLLNVNRHDCGWYRTLRTPRSVKRWILTQPTTRKHQVRHWLLAGHATSSSCTRNVRTVEALGPAGPEQWAVTSALSRVVCCGASAPQSIINSYNNHVWAEANPHATIIKKKDTSNVVFVIF